VMSQWTSVMNGVNALRGQISAAGPLQA
jgi:hypothetical protein